MPHYLRSVKKVQYEHILIEENQPVDQILDKICDLGEPYLYVYTIYERPQIMLKLEFRKFLPIGHLWFTPAHSAQMFKTL